jgi:PPM family protein phosphatase
VLTLRIAARSGQGAREHNEDDLRFGISDTAAYAVLSDGAGGHANGAVAADLVVRLVTMRLQAAPQISAQTLHDAAHEAHELLKQQQQQGGAASQREQMHATLVALWIDVPRGLALWTHVGDSRLYLLRERRVHHVTRDDSVVRQMLDAGLIDDSAAQTHPMKHHLLCALGVAAEFTAHTLQSPFELADGDALLLCSDGWWEGLRAEDIERRLEQAQEPEQWLQAMQTLIEQAAHPHQDNHSAIAVWVGELTVRA